MLMFNHSGDTQTKEDSLSQAGNGQQGAPAPAPRPPTTGGGQPPGGGPSPPPPAPRLVEISSNPGSPIRVVEIKSSNFMPTGS